MSGVGVEVSRDTNPGRTQVVLRCRPHPCSSEEFHLDYLPGRPGDLTDADTYLTEHGCCSLIIEVVHGLSRLGNGWVTNIVVNCNGSGQTPQAHVLLVYHSACVSVEEIKRLAVHACERNPELLETIPI